MKMYKKMFAFLLALTLVLSGFNINAESVLADEAATLTDVSITRHKGEGYLKRKHRGYR